MPASTSRPQPARSRTTTGMRAAAIAEDLIDEYRQFVDPVILGGGTRYFTLLTRPLNLRLQRARTFSSGAVSLRYQRMR